LTNVADLHIHTTASDGAFPAADVVRMASEASLEIIAITDHDSMGAFDKPCPTQSIEVIPGIELSAYLGEREVHVLGYFLDTANAELRETLKTLRQKRRARAFHIIRMLAAQEIDIAPADVFDSAGDTSVSRLHLAEILIDNGHSANLYEAFRDFLGPRGAAFVPKPNFSVAQAVEQVHSAGGAAVLAHPRNVFTFEEVAGFAAVGLDGIEAHYPTHKASEVARWVEAAKRLGLVATGGSDFHGRRHLNTPLGAARIPRESVDALFERSGPNAIRRIA